ncbi:MAG: HAMP domain-containing histidine kinase [Armatimonadetes bacterium]|nr:HAMP domain-containing histidine kinase [Armatimonadota bacterium]
MATRHSLSLVVGTTLATVIAAFANAEISRQHGRLEELERLRVDLACMLVHDLRVPLTGVLGGLEAMESGALGELTEEMEDAVGIATRGGQRLLGMIDDLLAISKVEAGQMQLDLKRVGLFCLVSSALELVEHSANKSKIELGLDVHPIDLEAICDYDMLSRVLVNLLSNAIRFTPSGGHISVEALRIESEVIISVTDNGEGIPVDYHKKIFEKFGLAESPSARRRWSTGLGLYFCRLVIELHGSRIWVESVPGSGSKFSFTLPTSHSTISQDDVAANP